MQGQIELREVTRHSEDPPRQTTTAFRFQIDTEEMEALKLEMIQGGETYRTFDVPSNVEQELNDLGFEVAEL